MRSPGTPVVSFGPLTLLAAVLIVPVLNLYNRACAWRLERLARRPR